MRTRIGLIGLAAATLVACNKPSDYDGDGFTADVDCNDNNAEQNPNADEICNGEDDDCDDETDNNPINVQTFYYDADGDQDGDPNTGVQSCAVLENYVSVQGDCSGRLITPAAVIVVLSLFVYS